MRHFYSWFVWSWQQGRPVMCREEPPPQQISAPQPVAGLSWIRGDSWGHVALSHRSSSTLQTSTPKMPALNKSSICQRVGGVTPCYTQRRRKFSGSFTRENSQHHAGNIQKTQEPLPPDSKQWPDGLIMYSRRVWIWNIPAGLTPPCWALACTQSRSRSLWPAPKGELIEVLGWT